MSMTRPPMRVKRRRKVGMGSGWLPLESVGQAPPDGYAAASVFGRCQPIRFCPIHWLGTRFGGRAHIAVRRSLTYGTVLQNPFGVGTPTALGVS